MNQKQKIEYQQRIENYVESNGVYDLLDNLLRDIIIDRPKAPIDYLINKLKQSEKRRIFLSGPNGKQLKEVAANNAQKFGLKTLSMSEIVRSEVDQATETGKAIRAAWQQGTYVPDDVMIPLAMSKIEEMEASNCSYIMTGYPRTRVQSLALQRAGVIPERFIVLSHDKEEYLQGFSERYGAVKGEGIDVADRMKIQASEETRQVAELSFTEYEYNLNGVKDVYGKQCHTVDGNGDAASIAGRVSKILLIRGKSSAPRRPPHVAIIGPPGAGCSTQAACLAEKYGLVHVSTNQLLLDQIHRRTDLGRQISKLLNSGELIPETITIELVNSALDNTDCKVHGWVLDGFPETKEQSDALDTIGIRLSHVFFLDAADDVVYHRIDDRKIDPQTGIAYSPNTAAPSDEIANRLIVAPEDSHEAVKSRLARYKENVAELNEKYTNISTMLKAENDVSNITQKISDALEQSIKL